MIQGKGSRRVSLSALRFPYVKKQKENIESSKNNPSKRRCFERKMKYAAASWPSIIETQLYSFSAILVFHPIFLKYRSRDCSVTGCRNDVQKRAPFLSFSLSLVHASFTILDFLEQQGVYLRVAVPYGGKFLIRDFLFSNGNLTVFGQTIQAGFTIAFILENADPMHSFIIRSFLLFHPRCESFSYLVVINILLRR